MYLEDGFYLERVHLASESVLKASDGIRKRCYMANMMPLNCLILIHFRTVTQAMRYLNNQLIQVEWCTYISEAMDILYECPW